MIGDEDVFNYLSRIEKKLDELTKIEKNHQVLLDELTKYIIPNTNKLSKQDIDICKEFINDNFYLNNRYVREHPILSSKYKHPWDINLLYDEILKDNDYICKQFGGRGNPKYIFKKENEEKVKELLKIKKSNLIKKINTSDIENIKISLKNKYIDIPVKPLEINYFLQDNFNIKSVKKRKEIFKQLIREKFFIKDNSGKLKINDRGCI